MDARVIRQEALDRIDDVPKRRCAGCVVEADIRDQPTVEQRHLLTEPNGARPPSARPVLACGPRSTSRSCGQFVHLLRSRQRDMKVDMTAGTTWVGAMIGCPSWQLENHGRWPGDTVACALARRR